MGARPAPARDRRPALDRGARSYGPDALGVCLLREALDLLSPAPGTPAELSREYIGDTLDGKLPRGEQPQTRARQLLARDRLAEGNLVRPTGSVARVALDEAIDGHLRHAPPSRQLAPGDRDHSG